MNERKQWFLDRVGKTVWRTENSCDCPSCKNVYEVGLNIIDETHAITLCHYEGELSLKYFDTKQERDQFEQQPHEQKG